MWIPGKFCFLEGNLCKFEGKFIILMDILVFFFQKFLMQYLTIFQGNFAFFSQPWSKANWLTLTTLLSMFWPKTKVEGAITPPLAPVINKQISKFIWILLLTNSRCFTFFYMTYNKAIKRAQRLIGLIIYVTYKFDRAHLPLELQVTYNVIFLLTYWWKVQAWTLHPEKNCVISRMKILNFWIVFTFDFQWWTLDSGSVHISVVKCIVLWNFIASNYTPDCSGLSITKILRILGDLKTIGLKS